MLIRFPLRRLKLILDRNQPLIHVDPEHRIEIICSDHLTCKTHDNYELAVAVMLLQFADKFIRYRSRILYDLLAKLCEKAFLFFRFECIRIQTKRP